MSIIFRGLVEITNITIRNAMNLTVFKEYFFEFVGEIVREDNDLIDVFIDDNFCMRSYGTKIFKLAFLAKWSEITDYQEMILIFE